MDTVRLGKKSEIYITEIGFGGIVGEDRGFYRLETFTGNMGRHGYSFQSPRQYSNPPASASPGRLMSAEYPASFNACINGRYL